MLGPQTVPWLFLVWNSAKRRSKASKSEIYINLHWGSHPRKADRFKTIHDYPKVLTLTPSTFWWAGAPPAIWVGGMKPCCSCSWPHFYISTRMQPSQQSASAQNTPVRTEIAIWLTSSTFGQDTCANMSTMSRPQSNRQQLVHASGMPHTPN